MIGFIVFGLVVGVLARLLVPGRQHLSLLMTLLLGLVGSVIGGVVANSLGTGDVMELHFLGAVVAIIAAIVLIVIGEKVGAIGRRRRHARGPGPLRSPPCRPIRNGPAGGRHGKASGGG